jgi:hypothetical protein
MEVVENEGQAITRLCARENAIRWRDIAKLGLNPLERSALIPVGNNPQSYRLQR